MFRTPTDAGEFFFYYELSTCLLIKMSLPCGGFSDGEVFV